MVRSRSTAPGEGTTFKIKIPLTLAIIPALSVSVAATAMPSRRSTSSNSFAPKPASILPVSSSSTVRR
ncbi:MAG: hypothetical protein R2710_02800 [Acidimicrobiales bacterium]